MSRHSLYQPRIQDRNVRRLYRLKVEHHERTGRKLPMTAIVNRILDDFFDAEDHDSAVASARSLPITADHAEEVLT
ncbi:MAG TPA: hypothetical protein P5164_19120 [Thermoanaerobaculia bacterium]|nr:hypothetical protein [Thermoanaerobaculia bacterium]